jgi:hypothetical protein
MFDELSEGLDMTFDIEQVVQDRIFSLRIQEFVDRYPRQDLINMAVDINLNVHREAALIRAQSSISGMNFTHEEQFSIHAYPDKLAGLNKLALKEEVKTIAKRWRILQRTKNERIKAEALNLQRNTFGS